MVAESVSTFATFPRRLAAYALDVLLFFLPLGLAPTAVMIVAVINMESPTGTIGRTPLIVTLIVCSLLVLLAFAWWLLVLGRGQTPGKQLMGIRVARANGQPLRWPQMVQREVVAKTLTALFFALLVFGDTGSSLFWIFPVLVDNCWVLLDRHNQTVHDKIMGSLVVRIRK